MKNNKTAKLLTIPMIIFTLFFVVIPLIYILVLSFLKKDILWGVTSEFTLDNYKKMLDPVYVMFFWIPLNLLYAPPFVPCFWDTHLVILWANSFLKSVNW